jgi:hypothetical protein
MWRCVICLVFLRVEALRVEALHKACGMLHSIAEELLTTVANSSSHDDLSCSRYPRPMCCAGGQATVDIAHGQFAICTFRPSPVHSTVRIARVKTFSNASWTQ